MFKNIIIFLSVFLLQINIGYSTGEPSTYFNIFVPPNNDNVQRNVCLIVTAIYDSTSFTIIDDDMDGDSDDSFSGILMAGQSYVLYIKDNGINDDARYASGGVYKHDGDYFIITSDKLVYASQSTDSDWQHDWVPSINKSSLGEKFIIYTPRTTHSNRDINVFVYEDSTTVTIRNITTATNTASISGYTNVNYFKQDIVAQVTLNIGEEIIHFNTHGRDLLETGKTYVIESNKPITIQYGALWVNARDGGGYVPSSNGTSSGELFYFAVPYQSGQEQEIRIVSWSDSNNIELFRYASGSWISMETWTSDSLKASDWVGRDYGATYPTMFKIVCSAGKTVSVFEANWMETGSPGTSDMATMVSSKEGTTAGKRFLVYMAPPGNESNVRDPFTGNLFGQKLTHVYLFSKDTAHVTVKDAYSGGTDLSRSYTILPGRYVDCYLTLSEWKNIYNGNGNSSSGPERPYLLIESDANISVMNTNFNDNWMMYFGSSQQQSFEQQSSSSSNLSVPGDTVIITSTLIFNSDSLIKNVDVVVVVGSGIIPTSSTFNNVTDADSIAGTISTNDNQSLVNFSSVPDIDPTKDYNVTTKTVMQVNYNNGNPVPNNTVINIETVISGTIEGEFQQSVSTNGIENISSNTASLIFTEVTNVAFVQDTTDSWTASWVDFNGDGYDDVYISNYGTNSSNQLYVNNGNGTFTEITTGSIVTHKGGSIASTWADVDNDNDRDCFVAVNLGSNSDLYLNNADQTFTKTTSDPSINTSGYHHGAAWADYDNDGNLDLFVSDFMAVNFNQLLHGNGDGTFSSVTDQPMCLDVGRSIGASWGDYNNDGLMDLFVPNGDLANNNLYKNLGNGEFEKITTGDIVQDGKNCVASCWGDYDNDGFLDLFVASSSNDENLLYHNNGDETFSLVTVGSIATDKGNSHGCNWVDIDNDGDLDLFVTNGNAQRKFLYLNNGLGVLIRNDNEVITSALSNSYGTCWSDYDRDGDMDLLMSTHGNEKDRFFTNNGNSNNWLAIKLVGTNSNVSAIGARVRVKSNGNWQIREVNSQSGLGGQNSLNIHFGLGNQSTVDSIEIKWPSGYTQYQNGVTSNQYIVIQEEDASLISGIIFYDEDGDCIQNGSEPSLAGVTINISPGNISTVSKANGEFAVRLPIGLYRITQEIGSYWTQNCMSLHTVDVTGTNQTWSGNNFPNQALTQGVDLKINMAASAQRKGFRNNVVVTYANVGTETSTSDILEITWSIDCIPISASPGWDSIENNTTYWNLSQIAVGGSGIISIIDSISVSSVVSDSVTISASITENLNELNNLDNQVTIDEEIVGAIDPNDMLVSPFGFGDEHEIQKEQELTYMIRFQNIGNFPAQNIEVSNVLPDGLDHNSFKLLNSSHSGNFIKKGNELHWEFLNIWLPDSTHNEPESHGFIKYSIRPLKNILGGELITNRAEIEFDFESPIKTNTVYNTIATLTTMDNQLIIYPNPGHSLVTLKLDKGFFWEGTDVEVSVEDALGRKMECDFSLSNGQVILNIFSLKRGTYIVTVHNHGAMFSAKVVKE